MNGPSWRYLIPGLVIFIALAVLAWLVIFWNLDDVQKTPRVEMQIELTKVLAQLVFVTLIGATITYIYNQHAKEKENNRLRFEENNKLRRDLLSSLIEVRAQVEKIRREYRLLPSNKRQSGYKQAIHDLLQARLNLSQVWHGTETWKELYLDDGTHIQAGLLGMKKYLDELIDEYEGGIEDFSQTKRESIIQTIANTPLFTRFVTGEGGEAYTQEFLEQNYRTAARMIRKHILPPE
ncbi:MAG TPA: hypothetical protein VKB05_02850 [Pyrinomonadaceae bacterium]|nr:hypothetical protein [Pyrinomonadaceae bacterium]